jgi:phage tail sheath protein FI
MTRKLGVHGDNLPTRKSKVITPSDFSIGAVVGQFERKYDKAFVVNGITEKQEIFGYDISSSWYGSETVDAFFNNVGDVSAKLYIKSHVGYDGSAIDAVIASGTVSDQTPETALTLKAAYQYKANGAYEYGISGNRTGYTLTNGDRFSTTGSGTAAATVYTITLTSVADIKIGDTVKIVLTGGVGATVYHVITAVDESAKTITWTDTQLDAAGTSTMANGDAVTVLGIRLRVWRKDIKGIVNEVDKDLGKIYCSLNSLVTDYYIENVFATSKWIDVTRESVTPASPEDAFPSDVSSVTYLTSGADGTAPTTSSHWSRDLTKMDELPFRFICNPETSTATIQQAIETYCQGREDNPKVIYVLPQDQTKSQLITLGNNLQRSDDVLGVAVADWIEITDPFATSVLAPKRAIPNVGFVMGCLIRTIETKGIHFIPQKDTPLFGAEGIDNDNIEDIDDDDRTDLAEAGINVIQFINGFGYIIRNFRTPSTSLEFKYFNAIVMREYIKISGVDSLQGSENQPNSFERIQEDGDAMNQFMYNLWLRGSTGSVRTGETFGQSQNTDGSLTKFADHVQVIADISNNPQANINAGERNTDIYFTFPAPAESIYIRTGLWLRS